MPKISVCMLTYYHEDYIHRALDSILEQVIDCDYEIIIGDDCSQDNTVNIIKEYQRVCSCNISLVSNERNLGIPENMYNTMCRCSGDYIVYLSGDDYIIDKHKFQKQLKFLENNKDFFGVAVPGEIRYDEDDSIVGTYPNKKQWGIEYTDELEKMGEVYCLNGIMIRNPMLTGEGKKRYELIKMASKSIDDTTMNILFRREGRLFTLSEPMIAHRIFKDTKDKHNYTSITNMEKDLVQHIELLNYIDSYFGEQVDLSIKYYLSLRSVFSYQLIKLNIKAIEKEWRLVSPNYRTAKLKIKCLKYSIALVASIVAKKLKIKR